MRIDIKSLILPGALGGIWGLTVVICTYTFERHLPMASLLFFPLLFAGAVPAAVIFSGKAVSPLRAVSVGIVSGCIYQLLSPLFPLLSSVLAGAALGGGLSRDTGKLGGILESVLSTLKGVVILPVLIISGSFIAAVLYGLTESPIVHWFFWGFWAVLGISFIPQAYSNGNVARYEVRTSNVLDEFTQDAKEIGRDLAELNSGFE